MGVMLGTTAMPRHSVTLILQPLYLNVTRGFGHGLATIGPVLVVDDERGAPAFTHGCTFARLRVKECLGFYHPLCKDVVQEDADEPT